MWAWRRLDRIKWVDKVNNEKVMKLVVSVFDSITSDLFSKIL